MLDDSNRLILTDDSGREKEMEIILTFDNEDNTRHFVLFKDPLEDSEDVYAYAYYEDGSMDEVTDPEELEMCEEVLNAWQGFSEDGEEEA